MPPFIVIQRSLYQNYTAYKMTTLYIIILYYDILYEIYIYHFIHDYTIIPIFLIII